jgi:hypothetical protein
MYLKHFFLLLLTLAPIAAHAARPLVTDDARTVDPDGCQIESYAKRQRNFGEREFWFLPACNPGGHAELTLGGTRTDNDASGRSGSTIAQAKFLLRPLATNSYGAALSLGAQKTRPFSAADPSQWNPYFNAIATKSLLDDRLFVHLNLGTIRDRGRDVSLGTWGLGTEIVLTPRIIGIVESYGQRADRPSRQIGLRIWVIPDKFQIDTTLGIQSGYAPDRRWNSVGIRLLF